MSAHEDAAAREELPSPAPQKRPVDDGDSGFHELIDDAATFELLPVIASGRSSSPQAAELQRIHDSHVAAAAIAAARPRANIDENAGMDSAYSTLTTPEYSPISPSPRSFHGNDSVSSNASTQPDGTTAARLESGGGSLLSPSPAGSEEDVSEKESDDAFEDAGSSSPEEEELGEHWNPAFYTLQSQAPRPQPVLCAKEINNRPPHYNLEYHGSLSREDAADILGSCDGRYLVRHGSDGDCILSFV